MHEAPSASFPLPVIQGDPHGPAPFPWQAWYDGAGGRTIQIDEADRILQRIWTDQVARFDGPVAEKRTDHGSPEAAAAWVKRRARAHGADLVGIARVEPQDVYRGRQVDHSLAIVVGQRMAYEAFVSVPSESAAVECLRVYETLGEVVINLANDLRTAGWPAVVEHPIGDSSVLHIPLALKAGFGELGRHGSIIHPIFGPLFRIGSVLTSMPLDTDQPIDAGIGAFCDKCQACRIFCPADAIPDQRSPDAGADPQGHDRYVVDTGKCFPYFARQNYCSACLATCAYHHKQWAVDQFGQPAPFPTVPFGTIPPPVDPTDTHPYPKLRRGEASPYHRKR